MKNYYTILCIATDADESAIIAAYRKKSLENHPDKHPDDREGATVRMQDINDAKQTLSDPNTRKLHDIEIGIFTKDLPLKQSEIFREQHNKDINKNKSVDQRLNSVVKTNLFSSYSSCMYDLNGGTKTGDIFLFMDANEKKEAELSVSLSAIDLNVQTAVMHFLRFLEGKYFGTTVRQLRNAISGKLRALNEDATSRIKTNLVGFYQAILRIINTKYSSHSHYSDLIDDLEKINNLFLNEAEKYDESFIDLFTNKYFRNLCALILHSYWVNNQDAYSNYKERFDNQNELLSVHNTIENLLKNIEGISTNDLSVMVQQKKMLDIFKEKKLSIKPNPDGQVELNESRELAFLMIDCSFVLANYMPTMIAINSFFSLAMLFLELAQLEVDLAKQLADENIALDMLIVAYSMAHSDTPDVEQYALTHALKIIGFFKYDTEKLHNVTKGYQERSLYLLDFYPFVKPITANKFLREKQGPHLTLLRKKIHLLLNINPVQITMCNLEFNAHSYVEILYKAYEAALFGWLSPKHEAVASEKKIRIELMQALLAANNWTFNDLRMNVDAPWVMVERDLDGWLVPINYVPIPEHPLLQKFKSLDAITINDQTGAIQYYLNLMESSDKPYSGLVTVFDIKELVARNLKRAVFSLDAADPNMPYHPFNKMRFDPSSIDKTDFLNTLLMTDYLLKFFTTNQEIQARGNFDFKPLDNLISKLPPYLKRILDNFHTSKASNERMHRFWIEAEDAPCDITDKMNPEDNLFKIHLGEPRMIIRKHALIRNENGDLIDKSDETEGWNIYILTDQTAKTLVSRLPSIIQPAIIFTKGRKIIYFYNNNLLSDRLLMQSYDDNLRRVFSLKIDDTYKVVTKDIKWEDEFFIYKTIIDVTKKAQRPHLFSKEYIFAQEFSTSYNLFALYFPEFGRLRELCKIILFIKMLNITRLSLRANIDAQNERLSDSAFWDKKHAEYVKEKELVEQIKKMVRDIINQVDKISDKKNARTQVYKLFRDKTRKNLNQKDYEHAVNRVMSKYLKPMMDYIADFEVDKIIEEHKVQLRSTLKKLKTLYSALSHFDMKSADEVDLTGRCLWVPANIKHDKVTKGFHLVYGGVNLQPTARFVTKGSIEQQILLRTTAPGSSSNPISQRFVAQLQQVKQTSAAYPGVPLPVALRFEKAVVNGNLSSGFTGGVNGTFARGGQQSTPAGGRSAAPAAAASSFRPPRSSSVPMRHQSSMAAGAAAGFNAFSSRTNAPAGGTSSGGPAHGGGSGTGGPQGPKPRGISPQAQSAANALRLRAELALKEANILDSNGRLTEVALQNNKPAMAPGAVIQNPSVIRELTKDGSAIKDWGKFSSESIEMSTGKSIQVHFYRNKITGEVNYTHTDFKIKDPVPLFWGCPKQEPKIRPGD